MEIIFWNSMATGATRNKGTTNFWVSSIQFYKILVLIVRNLGNN